MEINYYILSYLENSMFFLKYVFHLKFGHNQLF
jgi:hypothetical protein